MLTTTSKLFRKAVIFALLSISTGAYATDWFTESSSTQTVNWTDSLGTTETAGIWYDKDNPTQYIKGVYLPTDTFTISATNNSTFGFNVKEDLSIGGLTMTCDSWNSQVRITMNSKSLTINGNLNRTSSYGCFMTGVNALNITGNLVSNGNF